MLVYIRSCKYCENNPDCPYKAKIRDEFRALRLDTTAVVNCKRVIPFCSIGERVFISIYDISKAEKGSPFDSQEEKLEEEVISGVLAGYVFDRYGHARSYAVRIPRSYADHFSPAYYCEGENAKAQFPELDLGKDEIIVFVRYLSIERPSNGE